MKKTVLKWSALLSATAFVAMPGCDVFTGLFEQLLGGIVGA